MGFCPVESDRQNVLRYHVIKAILEFPLNYLRGLLPHGRVISTGEYLDSVRKYRVFFEHHRKSGGLHLGMWDRNETPNARFESSWGNSKESGDSFISLYAHVEGALISGGMNEKQATEKLAVKFGVPCSLLNNKVEGWKQVPIKDDLPFESYDLRTLNGYYKPTPHEEEINKFGLNKHHGIYGAKRIVIDEDSRHMYNRDGKLLGLLRVNSDGQTHLKTLWNKKPHSKQYEWHYSNFEMKPFPFDKTHLVAGAKNKIVYVIGDPLLAGKFEKWQEGGMAPLKDVLILTWFGGKETVADLDWKVLQKHDVRFVVRETKNDFQLSQAIIEKVVDQHDLKSISFYRYGTETVYTDSLLYSFDVSRAFNLANDAFLYQLSREDIYVGLGLEERIEAVEESLDEHDDSLVCIEGVLEREAATMLYAYDGVGKSMLALSMAFALASGKNVFGTTWKVSRPRKVLYVDAENPQTELERREKAGRCCYELDKLSPYYQMKSASKEGRQYDLTDKTFRDELHAELFTPSGKRKVDVLILDNWSALYSGDEDKAWRDINGFLTELKLAGIAILFVHHASDADSSKPDGYKKKNRFFDSRFYAVKNETTFPRSHAEKQLQWMSVSVHMTKSRSGAEHTDFDLWLSFVENKAGEERAFWLVDPPHEALDIFELRAKGMSYEDIGADKKILYTKSTAQRKFREGVPTKVNLDKWIKSK